MALLGAVEPAGDWKDQPPAPVPAPPRPKSPGCRQSSSNWGRPLRTASRRLVFLVFPPFAALFAAAGAGGFGGAPALPRRLRPVVAAVVLVDSAWAFSSMRRSSSARPSVGDTLPFEAAAAGAG